MNVARLAAAALAAVVALTACGGDDGSGGPGAAAGTSGYAAQVASYDLSVDGPQRFLVGILGTDGDLVVGGEVSLDFRFLGSDASETAGDATLVAEGVRAQFLPVAGGTPPPDGDGPRLRGSGEGVGVYEATGVTFTEPGFWEVTAHVELDGEDHQLTAAFPVAADNAIVDTGDPAPRTVNHLPGSAEAPPGAIDSRAATDGAVPDPELHEITVADAIATGRPTVVVVSTPVFCVSRFCGPITDSIQALAREHGDAANFVHLEVWRDFEGNALNAAAAEWIYPAEGVDAAEPWVFLLDGDGVVVERWDNVANEADVDAALRAILG